MLIASDMSGTQCLGIGPKHSSTACNRGRPSLELITTRVPTRASFFPAGEERTHARMRVCTPTGADARLKSSRSVASKSMRVWGRCCGVATGLQLLHRRRMCWRGPDGTSYRLQSRLHRLGVFCLRGRVSHPQAEWSPNEPLPAASHGCRR